jgi:hypothetical protein
MAGVLGFQNTFADPNPRYAILPKTATSLFSTLEGDAAGANVVQKDVFSLGGSPDLFHLASSYKTASPTGFMQYPDIPQNTTKSRTDASTGGFNSNYDFAKSYSGTDIFGLLGGTGTQPSASGSSPSKPAASLLGGGTPGQGISTPAKSYKGVLLAVGALGVLGIGLYVFLR